MIAIDTNVIVRHLTEDDAAQLKCVHQLFRKHNRDGDIFISGVVLIEMSWVLSTCYGWSVDLFCDAVEDMLRCHQFTIEHAGAVKTAIDRARHGMDFSDALIGQIGVSKNAKTYTFDQKLKQDDAFVLLKAKR